LSEEDKRGFLDTGGILFLFAIPLKINDKEGFVD
jgi:hypothetical protein